MSRRFLILAALIVGTAYASLLSRNWPSQLDPTFVVFGQSTVTPHMTSISPSEGARGSTVTVAVTGSGFAGNTSFVISSSPPYISATAVTVLSTTLMTADIMIPATTPTGTNYVTVVTATPTANITGNYLPFTVSEGLSCGIQMNKVLYGNGDQVIVQSLHVTNSSGAPQQIHYRLWLDIPGFPPAVFSQGGADGSVVLTPGFDSELGPIPLFQISEPLPRGTYAFGCRLVDTVRGNVLAENLQPFFLQ